MLFTVRRVKALSFSLIYRTRNTHCQSPQIQPDSKVELNTIKCVNVEAGTRSKVAICLCDLTRQRSR
jgi:hypothetical protein